MITLPDLTPLRTLLARLTPAQRQAFAVRCTRHALDTLPAEPARAALRVALDQADTAAGRQAVLGHPWGQRTVGYARYLIWQAACWASWPAPSRDPWGTEQAAWYSQHAVAEAGSDPHGYQHAAATEAAWQRAQLLPATIVAPAAEMEGHR